MLFVSATKYFTVNGYSELAESEEEEITKQTENKPSISSPQRRDRCTAFSLVLQPAKEPGPDYLCGCVREKVRALAVFLVSY